jgi:8-oxo-dGTP pyrophosphatase MutT (NUDIX family)
MYNRPVFLASELNEGLLSKEECFTLKVTDESDLDLFFEILDDCPQLNEFHLHNSNVEWLWKSFLGRFKRVEAGGGIVRNQNNELLCIKRNGLWDLPKGKIDKGESIENGALREVSEECGINGLELGEKIDVTYHVYTLREKEILKPTHWFAMDYSGDENLVPQEEEGITEVAWLDQSALPMILNNTHPTLTPLFEGFFSHPRP